MRIPPRLVSLLEDGIITNVIRPLLSGKEAQVYLVESEGQLCAAKVYKAANDRSFRNRSQYKEGRTVRNSRDQRAMGKRSKHGRRREEAAWDSAEADTIYKLDAAGVRVPKPLAFVDGVLIMECISTEDGEPAPRLADCTFEPEHADAVFDQLMREVARMLSVDVVHGDLSTFNVLIEEGGPVIIDFPQAINAAQNQNAKRILLRDVANLTSHFKRGKPLHELRYGYEMWDLYSRGELHADVQLTGHFDLPQHEVDAERLLHQMDLIEEDEALADFDDFDHELSAPRSERSGRDAKKGASSPRNHSRRGKARSNAGGKGAKEPQVFIKGQPPVVPTPAPEETSEASGDTPPKRRRRRRRRKSGGATDAPPQPSSAASRSDAAGGSGQGEGRRRRRRRGRGSKS